VSRNSDDGKSSVRETVTHVVVPAVTGALGIAGGVLLGRNALQQRNRKILGIPVPGAKVPEVKVDLAGVTKTIGEAGRQLGNLAREVQAAREKAEKLGRAIG
jgi:hypothetical protein